VESEGEQVGERTPIEELVVGVYEQVLRLEGVGVADNFFDLGGHSLLATQVVSRLRDLFHVDIPLRSLFESPTVAGLSRSIEALLHVDRECEAPPLLPVARDDEGEALPLSFAQQRMWFLNQFEPDSPFYNISVALRLAGPLNVAALEQSLREIVRRHETLRTTFPTVDGVAVQLVAATSDVNLPLLDLSELTEVERETEALRVATEEARRPFDLTRGPMMRSTLLRLNEEEHVVVLTMHHIISDGWSMGVFVREVAALYEAYSTGQPSPLPDLTIQYPDFANWQRQWLRDEVLEGQLAYWKRQLTDLPTLQFPTTRPRPDVQSFRGARRSMLLPESLSHALDELRRREGVTLFMTLLAAFQVLLHHYTGQPDIVVGTDISNRTRSETEGLIGFFANQLVLRTDLSDGPSFKELLARVRDISLEAYAHQDLPFDMLVKALKLKRDADRTPLFQAKIVLQNAPLANLELPGLTFHPLEIDGGTAKFDLLLTINEQEHGLFCLLEYNTDIFDSGAMLRLLERYQVLLNAVVEQPEASLSSLREMIIEADKQYLAAKQKTHRETRFRKLRELNLEEMRVEN
jgi:acyl carrier protein